MLDNFTQVKDDRTIETFNSLKNEPLKRIPSVQEIQKAFFQHTNTRYDLILPNIYIDHHNCEMDLVGLRPTGFIDEIEIKVSRADYLADYNKTVQVDGKVFHSGKTTEVKKHWAIKEGLMVPSYFSFLITQEMFDACPLEYNSDYYGLYIVRMDSMGTARVREYRKAPRLHARKANMLTRYKLARKFQYKYWRDKV